MTYILCVHFNYAYMTLIYVNIPVKIPSSDCRGKINARTSKQSLVLGKLHSDPLIKQPESDKEELNTLIKCEHCDLNFKDKNKLRNHITKVHERCILCDYCGTDISYHNCINHFAIECHDRKAFRCEVCYYKNQFWKFVEK